MNPIKVIDLIGGTRPNFVKIAAFFAVAKKFPRIQLRFIHTGQHYDHTLSELIIKELKLPQPVHSLNVSSRTVDQQILQIKKRYQAWIKKSPPDLSIVVGDVNSTLACAQAAHKLRIPVAHVESGLRSFDKTMPEEKNRIITDRVSQYHFVTEPSGTINLISEGVKNDSIYLVGNVMIDTLLKFKQTAKNTKYFKYFPVQSKGYAYLTLHRPSNVDHPKHLSLIMNQIIRVAERIPIIFSVHPRTQKTFNTHHLMVKNKNIFFTKPLGYIESLSLMMHSRMTITDSGGIQEETTALGIPCLTLRNNTERPITLEKGTNILIRSDWKLFHETIESIIARPKHSKPNKIPLWDGKTAERILQIIQKRT